MRTALVPPRISQHAEHHFTSLCFIFLIRQQHYSPLDFVQNLYTYTPIHLYSLCRSRCFYSGRGSPRTTDGQSTKYYAYKFAPIHCSPSHTTRFKKHANITHYPNRNYLSRQSPFQSPANLVHQSALTNHLESLPPSFYGMHIRTAWRTV